MEAPVPRLKTGLSYKRWLIMYDDYLRYLYNKIRGMIDDYSNEPLLDSERGYEKFRRFMFERSSKRPAKGDVI